MSRILKAFLENERLIRCVVARYRPKPEDVEELTQETFLKCFAAEQKQEISDPKRFLFRSARNIAISETRRHRNKTTDYLADSALLDVRVDEAQIDPETQLNSRQKLFLLAKAVGSLPEDDQRILMMRKMEHLKFRQIAANMSMSVSAVQKRATHALIRCSRYLREHGYDDDDMGIRDLEAFRNATSDDLEGAQ